MTLTALGFVFLYIALVTYFPLVDGKMYLLQDQISPIRNYPQNDTYSILSKESIIYDNPDYHSIVNYPSFLNVEENNFMLTMQ